MESDDPHALLRAVIRLEVKVDLMLEGQNKLREDLGGLDARLRQVETKVASLESGSKARGTWPQVATALTSATALAFALFK